MWIKVAFFLIEIEITKVTQLFDVILGNQENNHF